MSSAAAGLQGFAAFPSKNGMREMGSERAGAGTELAQAGLAQGERGRDNPKIVIGPPWDAYSTSAQLVESSPSTQPQRPSRWPAPFPSRGSVLVLALPWPCWLSWFRTGVLACCRPGPRSVFAWFRPGPGPGSAFRWFQFFCVFFLRRAVLRILHCKIGRHWATILYK